MNKTKKWLIFATSLVILGSVIFTAVMNAYKWDFEKLSTVKYLTKTYTVTETFKDIKINNNTVDIAFTLSADKNCKVVCEEEENVSHSVTVQDNMLSIDIIDQRQWYQFIGITAKTPKMTVYLPENEYNSLFIKTSTSDVELAENFKFKDINIATSTGDILVQNTIAENIKLSVSTGRVVANDVTCQNLTANVSTGKTLLSNVSCDYFLSSGDTGDLKLKDLITKEKITIERNTGDINFENCDANELFITTDTGDVTGSLLSDKIFETKTDTGDIDVPNSINGGICKITTNTGDIKINVVK
ncbi:MAG: DUF4097 domain-containing protein [Ruminococcaceae bacterium]|nr:DUF4097 domain-containing protein [Oscillospiraceae bacterium]